MKTIAAVVVTYNRLNLLKECIQALRNQTKSLNTIIVVNNGSTDGTTQWLAEQNDLKVYNQANLGGAGGFNKGIYEAFEAGYDYIWVMDDDGRPELNCLEKLFEKTDDDKKVIAPVCLISPDSNKLSFKYRTQEKVNETIDDLCRKYNSINDWGCFFNGILFSRDVIETCGLPKAEMFIWGDEAEYFKRLQKSSYKCITFLDAFFYHPEDRVPLTPFLRKFHVYNQKFDWKAYCFFRNHAYLIRNESRFGGIKLLFVQSFYYLHTLGLIKGLKTISMYYRAHRDGLNANFSKKLPF